MELDKIESEKAFRLRLLFHDTDTGNKILFDEEHDVFYSSINGVNSLVTGPLVELLEMAVVHWDEFMEVMCTVHKLMIKENK